jgi:arylsulfatase A-like enzyme
MNRSANTHSARATFVSLWLRLSSLSIVGFLFAEAIDLTGKVQANTLYLTHLEVAFECLVRMILVALIAVAVGTFCTVIVAPAVWYFRSSRDRLVAWAIAAAVLLVLFMNSKVALATLIKWSYNFGDHRGIFDTAAWVIFYGTFALALCIPRSRSVLLNSLDFAAEQRSGRRLVLGTIASAILLVMLEYPLARRVPPIRASANSQRPKLNFLLITFDALTAEDLSLYGRGLSTSPNLDVFARQATVFTNFYSTSTFTTPTVASILTGAYPSENGVFHLKGKPRPSIGNLPQLLRSGGYNTAGLFTNPLAHFLAAEVRRAFDLLPEPVFNPTTHQIWHATEWFHQDTGVGSRIGEYLELEEFWRPFAHLPQDPSLRMRPDAIFAHAKNILDTLPDGYFLWVHVITPHDPYVPDAADRGRFLRGDNPDTRTDNSGDRWTPHYAPDQQSHVDKYRLRYDEFILTADRALGSFLSELESTGRLQSTVVIVSADHGESFEGGVYRHKTPFQTRPVIHVPLIIRTPGQTEGRRITLTADQTSLAPTILDLAGLAKPQWMRGQSLAPWLKQEPRDAQSGLAFSQYLEKNSVFEPLRHGTVGVIDGKYQFVLDLDSKKGALRPLNEAHIWNQDRTAENPAKAKELLSAIYSRFPELRQESK